MLSNASRRTITPENECRSFIWHFSSCFCHQILPYPTSLLLPKRQHLFMFSLDGLLLSILPTRTLLDVPLSSILTIWPAHCCLLSFTYTSIVSSFKWQYISHHYAETSIAHFYIWVPGSVSRASFQISSGIKLLFVLISRFDMIHRMDRMIVLYMHIFVMHIFVCLWITLDLKVVISPK